VYPRGVRKEKHPRKGLERGSAGGKGFFPGKGGVSHHSDGANSSGSDYETKGRDQFFKKLATKSQGCFPKRRGKKKRERAKVLEETGISAALAHTKRRGERDAVSVGNRWVSRG